MKKTIFTIVLLICIVSCSKPASFKWSGSEAHRSKICGHSYELGTMPLPGEGHSLWGGLNCYRQPKNRAALDFFVRKALKKANNPGSDKKFTVNITSFQRDGNLILVNFEIVDLKNKIFEHGYVSSDMAQSLKEKNLDDLEPSFYPRKINSASQDAIEKLGQFLSYQLKNY